MIEPSTNPTELYEDRSQYTSFPPKAIRLVVLVNVSSALWTLQMPNLITIRPLKRIELPLPASGQDLHLSLSSGDSSTGNKFTISRSSFTGMVPLYCTIVVLFITPCWPPRSVLNLFCTQKQTVRWHYLLKVAIGVPRFSLKVPFYRIVLSVKGKSIPGSLREWYRLHISIKISPTMVASQERNKYIQGLSTMLDKIVQSNVS